MEISRKVNTILNCFVDMNLETNERFPYDIQLLSVSFRDPSYRVDEDASVSVTVMLNEVSTRGIEELDLVLSHNTTAQEDIGDIQFPIRLKWEIGEQEKVITIPISRDFIEEGDETFLLGLTNLCNLSMGEFPQTNILVLDTTVLRTVRIFAPRSNATNPTIGSIYNIINSTAGSSEDRLTLSTTISFTLIEGDQLSISVGLDTPSEFGVEKVEISISNSVDTIDLQSQPSVFLNSTLLEWNVGEQIKTVTVNTARDGILQGDRRMILQLANPIGVKLHHEENLVEITIMDPPVARRYAFVDFGRIFKQRGSDLIPSSASQNFQLHLKTISDGQDTNLNSLYWFVELGTFYTDENDNPELNESVNYPAWPNYTFGVNENGIAQGVSLKVTNLGMGDVTYGGQSYDVGESFFITMSRGSTSIILPTNDLLQSEGSILASDNSLLSENTFTACHYRFEIVLDIPQLQVLNGTGTAGPHGFILQTSSTDPLTYLIGEFFLTNHATIEMAASNPIGLYSSYTNMRTRHNGITCTNSYDGTENVRDVMIHGIALLSQNSRGTGYLAHNMLPMAGRTPICGASSGNANGLTWISIPFENN